MWKVERLKFPHQLEDPHFRIVKARGKAPNVEREWQTKNNYRSSSSTANEILNTGLNYGFTCPTGFACFIDADTKEVQEVLDNHKWTFRYSTGTPGHYQYVYLLEDEPIGCVPLKDGAYIKGKGGFTVGPGSMHPNGNVYGTDIRYAPIAAVRKVDLTEWLFTFFKKEGTVGKTSFSAARYASVSDTQIEEQRDQLLDLWIKADGLRHILTLSIVGYYQKKGWSLENIEALVSMLVRLSKKGEEHLKTLSSAYNGTGNKWGLPMILSIEKEVSTLAH